MSVRRQVDSELIVGHVCGCCSQQLYGLFTLAYLSHDSGVMIRFTWQIPRSGFTPTLQRRMLTRDLFAVANPRCENFQKTFIKRSASEIAETATLVYRSITVCTLAYCQRCEGDSMVFSSWPLPFCLHRYPPSDAEHHVLVLQGP